MLSEDFVVFLFLWGFICVLIPCFYFDFRTYSIYHIIECILKCFLKEGKEGIFFLFNDTLNTFCLRLYGIRHIVKDHSDCERKPTWATLSD